MVALRALATASAGLLFVVIGIAASRAQEAQKASPEQVLKSHDLKRTGTTWLLPGEAAILKDLRDARVLSREIGEGIAQQQAFEYGSQERQGQVMQLREQSTLLSQQVAMLNQQLANLAGATGNVYANQQRAQLARQHNILVAQLNQVTNQLNGLQDQSKDQEKDTKLQLNAEVGKTRERYMEAILELRKAVDEITAKYDELKNNQEVTKALASLTASTKSQHRLGPSKALSDAIKLLKRSAGSVQTESIELHRENGVFHVMAMLNGKVPIRMVFDTGAGLTTISAKLASQIGLKPSPTDSPVELTVANGAKVQGKRMTIPSVRVGKTTVRNVECAVMPEATGDVDPLLGQSFFKNLTIEFNQDTGRLKISKVDTTAGSEAAADADANDSPKAAAKSKRTARLPKATSRSKRVTRKSRPAGTQDGAMPEGDSDQPN
jgi:clan AA aspartic protease (TIGR02281 family)